MIRRKGSNHEYSDNTDKLRALLTKALDELNAGYNPEFSFFAYPHADNRTISMMVGCASDIGVFMNATKVLKECQSELTKSFVSTILGVEGDRLEQAVEQFERDVGKARERAYDRLKNDEPVRSTADADKLINELIERMKK